MTQLRQEYKQLEAQDIEVIVVGPEKPSAFKAYWDKGKIPFVGLPDPSHEVLTLYGQEVKILRLGRMPAQMLINKEGVLKFVYYGNSMADIPNINQVIEALNT
nr:redoxin domain-containing protein [uncultured Pseudodesulfovibrio sp.]